MGFSIDTNGGSGPRDVTVEVLKPVPGITEAQEPGYVHDFAPMSQIQRLCFWALISVWNFQITPHRLTFQTHRRRQQEGGEAALRAKHEPQRTGPVKTNNNK